jgi:hypothetical protein
MFTPRPSPKVDELAIIDGHHRVNESGQGRHTGRQKIIQKQIITSEEHSGFVLLIIQQNTDTLIAPSSTLSKRLLITNPQRMSFLLMGESNYETSSRFITPPAYAVSRQ